MRLQSAVFIATLLSVVFCWAVNCYTLRITYPLWGTLDPANFGRTHAEYMRRLTPVVTLPHIAMFFSSMALLRWRPTTVTPRDAVLIFLLGTTVILISAFIAGPVHARYTSQAAIDVDGQQILLRVSLWRVLLMTAATGLVLRPVLAVT